MKLPHIFNNSCTTPNKTSYFPSCTQQPKTLSFRSILYEETQESGTFYLNEPPKCSSALIEDLFKDDGGETIERVIRSLKFDRLFFEPNKSNSILGKAENSSSNVKIRVNFVSMESRDPYLDFKKSMEEMVEAHHEVMNWDWLHELLGCYFKVNGKSHHEFIIGAFLDLLVSLDLESLGLNFSSFVASSTNFSSSTSTCCSSSLNLPSDYEAAAHEDEGFGGL